ncbi:MAG: M28 family peptidase [Lentisphaerae bacterium]|nr:M28 family peptidase [Lentisphaerota bacterium]
MNPSRHDTASELLWQASRTRCAIGAILAALLTTACDRRPAPAVPPPPLQPARLLGDRAYAEATAIVAFGPRPAGSEAVERTATHLADRLRTLGATAVIDTFTNDTPDGPIAFHNVIGTLAGTAPGTVVLLSHIDTKSGIAPGFVGANDSASSSGLLLALAEALQGQLAGRPSVLIAFVDGEECRHAYSPGDGLHGSRHLAARLADARDLHPIHAVILLDMIGDRDLSVTIPRNGTPELVSAALAAADAQGCRAQFGLFPGDILDDHVPFLERAMPAVDLIDFHYGSAPGRNDYWHTEQDTLDKISPDSLQTVGRVVIRMLDKL